MHNRTIRRFTALGALALAIPIAALAQADAASPKDGARVERVGFHHGHHAHRAHHGKHHGHHHAHARGAHGGMHKGHMLRGLDLTETQRDQLFELRHAQAPKMRELGRTMRESGRALRAMSMSDSYDEARARELADAASKAGAEMALLRAQLGNETFKVLTPEQRKKLAERAERRSKGSKRGGEEARS